MAEPIRFEGVSLPVSDLARSVEFYCRLGFEMEVSRPIFALLRLGEGMFGLLKQDLSRWAQERRGSIHLELSTNHLDDLYNVLRLTCSPASQYYHIFIQPLAQQL
jgi:catechol 2,3-dioxygenase-like lactoylglutathione lyase family enzyme